MSLPYYTSTVHAAVVYRTRGGPALLCAKCANEALAKHGSEHADAPISGMALVAGESIDCALCGDTIGAARGEDLMQLHKIYDA